MVHGVSRRVIGTVSVCLYAFLGLAIWPSMPVFGGICLTLAVIRMWFLVRQWNR